MPAPLIARDRRVGAVIAVAVAVIVTCWLSVLSYHAGSTAFDTWASRTAYRRLGTGAADALGVLSEPALTVGLTAAIVLLAAVARRWDIAVLAAAGPALAELVTEALLKPVVGRLMGPDVFRGGSLDGAISGAFPSGHETGVASAAIVLLIVATRWPTRPAVRRTVFGGLGAWIVLAALGLVRNFYHYASDTIGAIAVSVAVVLGVALAVDRWLAPVLERADLRRRQLT